MKLNDALPELQVFHVSLVLFKKIFFLLFIAAQALPNLDIPWDFVPPAASSDHSVLWPHYAWKIRFKGQESESQLINRWPSTKYFLTTSTMLQVPLER